MKITRYHFESIGSTNTWAKEQVQTFDPQALTLITASGQTAGRGRFKRQWLSPAGLNVYATFCFFLEANRIDIGHVPQLLALSTAEILETLGFKPTLKWPNDLLLAGKKVGGILCETVIVSEKRCVICGIGLNINMPLTELQRIDRPATSLLVESGKQYKVIDIIELIKKQFLKNLKIFLRKGFTSFFDQFQERSYLMPGQKVRFHDDQEIVEGHFVRLNPDGSITLRLLDNAEKNFYVGEFLH